MNIEVFNKTKELFSKALQKFSYGKPGFEMYFVKSIVDDDNHGLFLVIFRSSPIKHNELFIYPPPVLFEIEYLDFGNKIYFIQRDDEPKDINPENVFCYLYFSTVIAMRDDKLSAKLNETFIQKRDDQKVIDKELKLIE